MADTIQSLITGISRNKAAIVEKLNSMKMFPDGTDLNKVKLEDCAGIICNIYFHESDPNKPITVDMGEEFTIVEGYHKNCVIKGGPPDDVTKVYKLQEIGVSSPEPDATVAKVVTLVSDGDAANYYGMSKVTIQPLGKHYINASHADIALERDATQGDVSPDVLSGKVACGCHTDSDGTKTAKKVRGSMPNRGAVTGVVDVAHPTFDIEGGYHNGDGSVIADVEELTVDCPTDQSDRTEIKSKTGKFLSRVFVKPLHRKYADTTEASIHDSVTTDLTKHVLKDTKVYARLANGYSTPIDGAMPNNSGWEYTLNDNITSIEIPIGYHAGGKYVKFDDSVIIAALQAI